MEPCYALFANNIDKKESLLNRTYTYMYIHMLTIQRGINGKIITVYKF